MGRRKGGERGEVNLSPRAQMFGTKEKEERMKERMKEKRFKRKARYSTRSSRWVSGVPGGWAAGLQPVQFVFNNVT